MLARSFVSNITIMVYFCAKAPKLHEAMKIMKLIYVFHSINLLFRFTTKSVQISNFYMIFVELN